MVAGKISTGSLNMTRNVALVPSDEKVNWFEPSTRPEVVCDIWKQRYHWTSILLRFASSNFEYDSRFFPENSMDIFCKFSTDLDVITRDTSNLQRRYTINIIRIDKEMTEL